MEYYAVVNLFNSRTPELTSRVLTYAADDASMWQPSKELAIQYAQHTLHDVLKDKLDSVKLALEHDRTVVALGDASQLTILTLKLTALIHLAIANSGD